MRDLSLSCEHKYLTLFVVLASDRDNTSNVLRLHPKASLIALASWITFPTPVLNFVPLEQFLSLSFHYLAPEYFGRITERLRSILPIVCCKPITTARIGIFSL